VNLIGSARPRAALLRHEGESFIYVQTGPESFTRRGVELERPLLDGWLVKEGAKAARRW